MRLLAALCFGLILTPGAQQPTPLGLDLYRPVPASNPVTPAKVALGRALFFDQRLSGDGTVACATCHDPARAFTDGRTTAAGVGGLTGRRNVPTVANRVYGQAFFWDGRAGSLEAQAREPLLNPREMGATVDHVVALARADAGGYRRQFETVYGRLPGFDDVTGAIATYVRTVRSGDSRVDRYRSGDSSALSGLERRGMLLFFGRAQCGRCHTGPAFSDEDFHNTGVAYRDGPARDVGRYGVTGERLDLGSFKTPTLRDIARTAPYMHDGSLPTLEAVVDFYDRGGVPNPNLDPVIRPIGLNAAEKHGLVAFLRALSGSIVEGSW